MEESEVWDYGRCAQPVVRESAMICRLEEEDRGRRGSVKVWDGAQIMQATKNLAAPLNVSVMQHTHIYSKCVFPNNIRLGSIYVT